MVPVPNHDVTKNLTYTFEILVDDGQTSAEPFLQARKSGAQPSIILLTLSLLLSASSPFSYFIVVILIAFDDYEHLPPQPLVINKVDHTDHILPLLSWELFNAFLQPTWEAIPEGNTYFHTLLFGAQIFIPRVHNFSSSCVLLRKVFWGTRNGHIYPAIPTNWDLYDDLREESPRLGFAALRK